MTVHVVGHSRGLGEYLYNAFATDMHDVRGYSRSNGYDLEKDIAKICFQVEVDDIVILNAYANGTQIDYLKSLENSHANIVVMGSIASIYPDTDDLVYSQHKNTLELYFNKISAEPKHPMLYLRLTGTSYNDYKLVYDSIKIWLANPRITTIGYSAL
jgi:short-subunit dehydrogenase